MKKIYFLILMFIQLNKVYSQCNLNISVIKEDYKCNGGASTSMNGPTPLLGSITTQASGGQAPYQYKLNYSQYQNTGVFEDLYPDYYTLTIKDAANCTKDTIIEITEPPAPQIVSLNTIANGCECTNVITANVINGTPPYTITTGLGLYPQINDTLFNLCPGIYTITAIDSLGCLSNFQMHNVGNLTQNGLLLQTNNPSCTNTCDGSIEIVNYSSNVNYTISPPATMANNTFAGLCSGIYTISSTYNGWPWACSTSHTLYLSPNPFSSVISAPALCSYSLCSGSITIDSSICYSYTLFGAPTVFQPSTNGNTMTFSNLCPGSYTIVATDAVTVGTSTHVVYVEGGNNFIQNINHPPCTGYGAIYTKNYSSITYQLYRRQGTMSAWQLVSNTPPFLTIQNGWNYKVVATNTASNCTSEYLYTPPPPSLNGTFNNAVINPCQNSCNGSITPSFSGALIPNMKYFLFKNGILLDSILHGSKFTNLCAGTYYLKVRSNLGCEKDTTIELAPPNLNYTLLNYPGCSTACQGSISLQMQGGKAPFTYTLTSINGTNSIGSVVTNLCEGVYTISASDSIGCSATVGLQLSNFLYFGTINQNATCQTSCNGSINVALSGNSPFTYTFSPQNGAFQNGYFISNLCSDTYTITATDKDGCTKAIVTAIQPNYYAYLQSEVDLYGDCLSHKGQLKTKYIGGVAPYKILSDSAYTIPFDEYFRIPNISVGEHIIVASDTNGCIITDTISIPYNKVFIDSIVITPETCNPGGDGAIALFATDYGGWPFFSIDSANWTPVMTQLTNLAKGTYKVYVVNGSNCTADTIISLPFSHNLLIELDSLKSVSCSGAADAFIQMPIDSTQYLLNPGSILPDTKNRFDNLNTGAYSIQASQPDGCMGYREVYIPEPAPLSLELNDIHHTYGDCHGKVTPQAYGGTAPYTYSVSPSTYTKQDKESEINYLCNTTYTITATDANGCTTSQYIYIPYTPIRREYYNITLSPSAINISYIRNMDVHLSLYDASGRRIHYQFDGDKNRSIIPLNRIATGVYFLELRFDSDIIIEKLILTQ